MDPDTLRAMAVFVEVAKTKSYTRAASSLDLPKSTVSRRVVELEREVGLRLLKRTTQKVELTEEGAAYFERCRRILQEADIAHEELGTNRRAVRGHLRVAATADFGLRLVAQLPDFCRSYPNLTLDFDFTSRRIDPLSENCDVAIYIGEPPDSTLTARKLGEARRFIYASPDYLRVHGEPTSPAELIEHNCVREARFDGTGIERCWRLVKDREWVEVAIQGSPSMNSIGIIRRVVANGLGIAVIPEHLCREDVRAGLLVRILREWSAPLMPIYALTATRLLPAKTKVFLEFVQRQL